MPVSFSHIGTNFACQTMFLKSPFFGNFAVRLLKSHFVGAAIRRRVIGVVVHSRTIKFYRASQLAVLCSVPARIVELDDTAALEWQLVELSVVVK